MLIPSLRSRLDPCDQPLWRLGIVTVQGSTLEDALNRFGHVQPTPTQGGVEGQNPVGEEPEHDRRGRMALEVVQDEQHAQRGQLLGPVDSHGQSLLPALPLRPIRSGIVNGRGQGGEDVLQFAFEPGMEDGIGGVAHAFNPDLTRGGARGPATGMP